MPGCPAVSDAWSDRWAQGRPPDLSDVEILTSFSCVWTASKVICRRVSCSLIACHLWCSRLLVALPRPARQWSLQSTGLVLLPGWPSSAKKGVLCCSLSGFARSSAFVLTLCRNCPRLELGDGGEEAPLTGSCVPGKCPACVIFSSRFPSLPTPELPLLQAASLPLRGRGIWSPDLGTCCVYCCRSGPASRPRRGTGTELSVGCGCPYSLSLPAVSTPRGPNAVETLDRGFLLAEP